MLKDINYELTCVGALDGLISELEFIVNESITQNRKLEGSLQRHIGYLNAQILAKLRLINPTKFYERKPCYYVMDYYYSKVLCDNHCLILEPDMIVDTLFPGCKVNFRNQIINGTSIGVNSLMVGYRIHGKYYLLKSICQTSSNAAKGPVIALLAVKVLKDLVKHVQMEDRNAG